jgi:ABC-type phosphate transport system auxiliary subunit
MEETMENIQKISKRKVRILQSTFARLRRKASKAVLKKHKLKKQRENEARANGAKSRLPKQKRHES